MEDSGCLGGKVGGGAPRGLAGAGPPGGWAERGRSWNLFSSNANRGEFVLSELQGERRGAPRAETGALSGE